MRKFSFSGIGRYLKCSYYYWLWHFQQEVVPRPISKSVPTVAGDIFHSVIEEHYDEPDRAARTSINDLLHMHWVTLLSELDLLDLYEDLQGIARDVIKMELRAESGYKGMDAIVDDKGKAYTKPKQTNAWRRAEAALQLPERRSRIDTAAKAASFKYPKVRDANQWQVVSMADTYAKTFFFESKFVDTISNLGLTVLAQELPISSPKDKKDYKGTPINLCYLPDGTAFTGYIDMICQDAQGRLYLIDHKTSKDEPSPQKVMVWEQLLLYCWAHEQIFKRKIDFIGINSIVHGTLVLARVHQPLIPGAVLRFQAAIKGIDAEVYVQKSPADYDSPCYKPFNKDQPWCDYASHCHPEFFKAMGGIKT